MLFIFNFCITLYVHSQLCSNYIQMWYIQLSYLIFYSVLSIWCRVSFKRKCCRGARITLRIEDSFTGNEECSALWAPPWIPPPCSRKLGCPPPPRNQRGGGHSPASEGMGKSQFRRVEKKLSILSTLWCNRCSWTLCYWGSFGFFYKLLSSVYTHTLYMIIHALRVTSGSLCNKQPLLSICCLGSRHNWATMCKYVSLL
jgi:hypothetical protein